MGQAVANVGQEAIAGKQQLVLQSPGQADQSIVVSTVNAGMGAPPVVIGLLSATVLWRSGMLGDLGLMYTRTAMVLAQVLIAIPLIRSAG